ncbi:DHHC zinc finger domain containing protein [Tritrichomonas foetus]|uniref:Palmitoyltransferase n=1 Tax=Tritrichomonas foetus TaxID=1144522 RepID=A0A1J4KM30_9EUKA|nr:DHHC zinc finger domain containing protein [Tritrichomonas foetus]|eukprot:OHT10750.1 DHHC zinc finger domain containing protein [Tritrichomonas foetus]
MFQYDALPKNQISHGYRPLMVMIHLVAALIYPFTETRFTKSFFGNDMLYYFFNFILWSISANLFNSCCTSPGFVQEDSGNPSDFFCKHCNIHIPIRAAHCKSCNRCVIRRDHHCPWTGQCIGRDNHFSFWLWLLSEIILMGFVIFDCFASLLEPISFLNWFYRYFFNIVALPFMCFDMFMVASLFIGHTVMALNNITTWEIARRNSISYLEIYPVTMNPFNKGKWNNFVEFARMKSRKITWDSIEKPKLSDFTEENEMFQLNLMNSLFRTYAKLGLN